MANRILDHHLQSKVDLINKLHGVVEEPSRYTKGTFVLDHAYHGVCLSLVLSDAGAERDVFDCGYTTKRDLHNLMSAYIRGFNAAKEVAKPKVLLRATKWRSHGHGGDSEDVDYEIFLNDVRLRGYSTHGSMEEGYWGYRAQGIATKYAEDVAKTLNVTMEIKNA